MVKLYDSEELRFQFSCSQEKVESMLIGLGLEEYEATMKEQGSIDIDCDCDCDFVIRTTPSTKLI